MATNGTAALRRLLDQPRFAAVRALVHEAAGAELFVVGGAVRDALLHRTPTDVDLLVRGVPLNELRSRLTFGGELHDVGTRFGVLSWVPRVNGRPTGPAVEVALPRTERPTGRGGYRDVAAATDPALPIEADLGRRDFTINAMAWQVGSGRLVDPFDGRGDLERRVVRAVGEPERRFAEDRSRMLRAIRFAAQLGFTIEPTTLMAIKAQAATLNEVVDDQRVVPNETIGREFLLALHAAPRRTIELLDESGLLPHVLPELEACRGIEQYPLFHPEGDVFVHTLDILGRVPADASLTLVVACLCHDLGKAVAVQATHLSGPRTGQTETLADPQAYFASGEYNPSLVRIKNIGHSQASVQIARQLFSRLVLTQFTHDPAHPLDRDEVLHAIAHHLLLDIQRMRPSKAERILFRSDGTLREVLLELARIDPTPPQVGQYEHALARIEEIAALHAEPTDPARAPLPLLTGADLIAAGFRPGPQFSAVLEAVRNAQLAREVSDKETALAWVRARFAWSS